MRRIVSVGMLDINLLRSVGIKESYMKFVEKQNMGLYAPIKIHYSLYAYTG